MGYWFNSHARFEGKESRQNRLVLGFNYSDDNKTRQTYIFLNQNVTIPTRSIKAENTINLESLAETLETTSELSSHSKTVYIAKYDSESEELFRIKYPAWEVKVNDENEHIIQISLSNDPHLIDLLPKSFQTSLYDRTFRYDNDWLLRKTCIDAETKGLNKVTKLDIQRAIDNYKNKVSKYLDEVGHNQLKK